MQLTRFLAIIALMLFGLLAGCSSSSDGPTLPAPGGTQGGDYEGDQPEPPIPTPYADLAGAAIADMEWEWDGDLVVAVGNNAQLYTPYGLFKRTIGSGGGGAIYALANNKTGRGMSYMPQSSAGNC